MIAPPKIVFGVPGPWADFTTLKQAVCKVFETCNVDGDLFSCADFDSPFRLDLQNQQAGWADTVRIAGRGQFDQAALKRISDLTSIAYLILEGGSPKRAREAMRLATTFLDLGGLAVKVESSGLAFPPQAWRQQVDDSDASGLIDSYVTIINDQGRFYSCGMHNLGLPEALVRGRFAASYAVELLDTFVTYQLQEIPNLIDGDTFRRDPKDTHYRLSHAPCTDYSTESLFHNPYGVWKLNQAF